MCAAVYALARLMLGFVWIYQGLVPKLIFHDASELQMLRDAGITASQLSGATFGVGVLEIAFGVTVLLLWMERWPLYLTTAAMLAALLEVGSRSPMFLVAAFNPVTLNFATATLAVIGLLLHPHVPTSSRCRRRAPGNVA